MATSAFSLDIFKERYRGAAHTLPYHYWIYLKKEMWRSMVAISSLSFDLFKEKTKERTREKEVERSSATTPLSPLDV